MSKHTDDLKVARDKKIQDDIDKLNAVKENSSPSLSVSPSPTPSNTPSATPSPSPTVSASPSPSPSPSEGDNDDDPNKNKKVIKQKEPDYKKKFSSSSKEAIFLANKNKTMRKAVDDASLATVTDEELKIKFPEWDLMSDTEKVLARDNMVSKKKFDILHNSVMEGKDADEWNEKIEKYISNPKTLINFPELDGKEDDFKIYAIDPVRRNMPIADLIASFLYTTKKVVVKKKGSMFEKGSGGSNVKDKNKAGKISTAEAAKLMKTDYKKWRYYNEHNLIDNSDIG